MTRRAAIYARFSSDRQNERSCDDQAALCAAWAERQDLIIVDRYQDAAISGASTVNRFGLASLMRDAKARRFDVVLCEALDRLSRDQADLARLKKELAFLDIAIMTVQDGEVGAMHIGLKGLMGELYLADLAQKTRRGQSARVRSGALGGGRSFGYLPIVGKPGEVLIVEAEAEIVRRIFTEFVAGRGAREIAVGLNRDGVAGPRGAWNASTIAGSKSRQNGILQNRLYVGEIVWNRQRFIKDPATGKRVSRPNPPSEWVIAAAPQLAIIDQTLFDAAQERRRERGMEVPAYLRRPKHLLSGLIKCSVCGSNYIVTNSGRLGCAGYRERGTCSNSRTVLQAEIEARVIAALETQLADPEVVAEYVRTYRAERTRLAKEAQRDRRPALRRLGEVERLIRQVIDRILDGPASASMEERLVELEAEKVQLKRTIATCDQAERPAELHPNAAETFKRLVAGIKETIADRQQAGVKGENAETIIASVRSLVEKIVVTATPDSKMPVALEVHGLLAALLTASKGEAPSGVSLVAGTRNTQSHKTILVA